MIYETFEHEIFDTLRDLNKRGDDNIDLIVEGLPAVHAALASGFKVLAVYSYLNLDELSLPEGNFQFYQTTKPILSKVLGFPFHRHAIATLSRPRTQDLDNCEGPFVFLNNVTSPENVGSIVRTCAAFGVKTVIFDYLSCSPFVRRCVRVSMGNCFRLNIVKSDSPLNDLKKLKALGNTVYSFELTDKSEDLRQVSFQKNAVFVFGSEGHGVEKEIIELSDQVVEIKMATEVGSLNVSQSAAIALYQLSLSY